jgi:hypothetical protein
VPAIRKGPVAITKVTGNKDRALFERSSRTAQILGGTGLLALRLAREGWVTGDAAFSAKILRKTPTPE